MQTETPVLPPALRRELAHLTECHLATVEWAKHQSRFPKRELERLESIARKAVQFAKDCGVTCDDLFGQPRLSQLL